jgi:hypothetical protein
LNKPVSALGVRASLMRILFFAGWWRSGGLQADARGPVGAETVFQNAGAEMGAVLGFRMGPWREYSGCGCKGASFPRVERELSGV